MNKDLIYPLLALTLLPLLVVSKLFVDRLTEMKSKKIHPQKVATRVQSQAVLLNSNANDNLKNLFELPIIFYVLILLNIFLNQTSQTLLILAWSFVAFRYVHSFIHCTYNKVMHRFYAFVLSTVTLFAVFLVTIKNVA